jgi:hypothetical protein
VKLKAIVPSSFGQARGREVKGAAGNTNNGQWHQPRSELREETDQRRTAPTRLVLLRCAARVSRVRLSLPFPPCHLVDALSRVLAAAWVRGEEHRGRGAWTKGGRRIAPPGRPFLRLRRVPPLLRSLCPRDSFRVPVASVQLATEESKGTDEWKGMERRAWHLSGRRIPPSR